MKTRLILLVALALLLNACATVKPATATEADASSAYMHAVESVATGRATKIIWVHPPSNEDLERKKD
jgi:starvation-inducible outer membrane lipoprotein